MAVAVAKGQMFKAENGKPTSTAYTVLTLPPFNQYDLTTMPNLHAYPDLKSFVTVRYPAVRIKDGEAYLLSSSAEGLRAELSQPENNNLLRPC